MLLDIFLPVSYFPDDFKLTNSTFEGLPELKSSCNFESKYKIHTSIHASMLELVCCGDLKLSHFCLFRIFRMTSN